MNILNIYVLKFEVTQCIELSTKDLKSPVRKWQIITKFYYFLKLQNFQKLLLQNNRIQEKIK